MTQPLEAVAEAICIADEDNPEPDWDNLPENGKRHYRKLAAAAVEALGLTEEQRHCDRHKSRCAVGQEHRLVYPWVREEQP